MLEFLHTLDGTWIVVNTTVGVSLVLALGLAVAHVLRDKAAPVRHAWLLCVLGLMVFAPVIMAVAEWGNTGWLRWRTDAPASVSASASSPVSSSANKGESTKPRVDATPSKPMQSLGKGSERILAHGKTTVRIAGSKQTPAAGGANAQPTPAVSDKAPVRPISHDAVLNTPSLRTVSLAWLKCYGLTAALAVWVLGTVASWVWITLGVLRLQWARRQWQPCDDRRTLRIVQSLAHSIGLNWTPRVLVARDIATPFTVGWRRPVVVLPDQLLEAVSVDEVRAILLHEMAHISRRDTLVGFMQAVVVALFWWHPWCRQLDRKIAATREEICDNYVLKDRKDGRRYAELLIDLAERSHLLSRAPMAAALANPLHDLEDRVKKLLEHNRATPTSLHWTHGVSVMGLTILTLVLMLGLNVARANQDMSDVVSRAAKGDKVALTELRKLDEPALIDALSTHRAIAPQFANQELLRIGTDAAMAAMVQGAKSPAKATAAQGTAGVPQSLEDTLARIDAALARAAMTQPAEAIAAHTRAVSSLKTRLDQDTYTAGESKQAELHVVSIYEGVLPKGTKRKFQQTLPGNVTVKVTYTERPVTLLLASYEPVNWKVDVAEGVTVESVFVNGYHRQTVSGLSADVPVQNQSFKAGSENLRFVFSLGKERNAKVERLTSRYAGMPLTTYLGSYRGAEFEIGPGSDDWRHDHTLTDARRLLETITGKPLQPTLSPELADIRDALDNSENDPSAASQAAQQLAAMTTPEARAFLMTWARESIFKDNDDSWDFFNVFRVLRTVDTPEVMNLLGTVLDSDASRMRNKMLRKEATKTMLYMAGQGMKSARDYILTDAKTHIAQAKDDPSAAYHRLHWLTKLPQSPETTALLTEASNSEVELIQKEGKRLLKKQTLTPAAP